MFDDAHYVREKTQNGARKLTVPVLAIGGEHGAGQYVADGLRAVAENVTGRVFAGCGHYIAEEKPDELTGELLAFLG